MNYSEYFEKFNKNDNEEVVQFISNQNAERFLTENAPRLYCPDEVVEETFAFRTWTMRKHIMDTEDGFLLSEFLTKTHLSWAGKHNTINAALTHHLNEFRWLKNSDAFLDYISFFLTGEGSAYAYHTPALTAMYNFCILTANEGFLIDNASAFEKYFSEWEKKHLTDNGLYWSIDDREGTEFTISGTMPDMSRPKGFRLLLNSCMYADALSLSKIFALIEDKEKEKLYSKKASYIKSQVDEKMWDGEFYKAIHPYNQDLDRQIDFTHIPEECNVRELMGYIPWAFNLPSDGKSDCFSLLKDPTVFNATTGFTTADTSHPRFLFYQEKACTWNGNVWPYATSYAINAVIELLNNYVQDTITEKDLYAFIKKYAEMHYSIEDGEKINFIDEVMRPFEYIWNVREAVKNGYNLTGGPNRGRDYNHSTFIDLVLRGLCGIDVNNTELTVNPKIQGIWKWFKIENLTFRKSSYNVYYDEDGTAFNKGKGVIIEKI
ncbi:MAG: hypothetical protein IKL05_06220 [Clostridia bacterium]|nr:hypothetical protein [Clostridia bacterium]